MKLPRWLVIGMLTTSVLSVLAAAGWWWVTWPERTAREFALNLSEFRFDDARRLSAPPVVEWVDALESRHRALIAEGADTAQTKRRREDEVRLLKAAFESPHLKDRTAVDILHGQLDLEVKQRGGFFTFAVRRGTVTY